MKYRTAEKKKKGSVYMQVVNTIGKVRIYCTTKGFHTWNFFVGWVVCGFY